MEEPRLSTPTERALYRDCVKLQRQGLLLNTELTQLREVGEQLLSDWDKTYVPSPSNPEWRAMEALRALVRGER